MRVLVVVLLVACGGSKPPQAAPVSNATPVAAAPEPPPEPASRCGCTSEDCGKLCRYRDRMCACKDRACGETVNDAYMQWMTAMAKEVEDHPTTPRPRDEAMAMANDATEYQACYGKLNGASGAPP